MGKSPQLKLEARTENWQLLQGRLAAAKWLSLSEPEVSAEIVDLESNEVFKKMVQGAQGDAPVVRRSRWPASSLHAGFYELKDHLAEGSDSADISELLEEHKELLGIIRGIGAADFERYFLYGEEGVSLEEACRRVGIALELGRRISDLLLAVGARSEFFRAAPDLRAAGIRYHCIADIELDPRDPESLYFRFLSAYWARGRYVVDYDKLEAWKKRAGLSGTERRRLRQILKRMELINMRQDTLFQILSRTTTEQSAYLRSRLEHRRRPLSLRELARRIGVAPSTVSRAVGNRSVRLPWGEEVPLKTLLSGQRLVILSILSEWERRGELGAGVTDEALMRRLASESGIAVSRRTVNECRRKRLGL